MNPIAEDILEHLSCDNEVAEDILEHYGTKRHSGRYPWGSGDNPYQSASDFYGRVQELKKSGLKETEIAEYFDMSTTELRAYTGVAKQQRWSLNSERARSLREDGLSTYKIAEKMGVPESTVRLYLDDNAKNRMDTVLSAAKFIERNIDEKGMIDIGAGVERQLNLTPDKMNQVIAILNADGYPVQGGGARQVTNKGQQTILRIACPPGTPNSAIYDYDKINYLYDTSLDGINPGETSKTGFRFPESLDSKRLLIRLHDEVGPDGHTGVERDGVIQIRRGVPDLDLGNSNYAQVRIMVDGTHYLKGMAVYSDDIPDGYDCVFNSNKYDRSKALKEVKRTPDGEIDRDNPFGSLIKEEGGQSMYIGKDGKEHPSLINKRADEGDWGEWGDKLPSQFLAKQSQKLIDQQLGLAIDDKVAEYNDICELNNPTVKRKMLETFASDCDSAAVHLKAASLPRSKYQVILPIPDMKSDEVYAPNYEDGEKVALVRYPHGGTFEIPILTVNNKMESARKVLGTNAKDAIGINAEVAGRLSGADFDGDTCMVIPTSGNGRNSKVKIVSTPPLKGLEGFDPTASYGGTKVVADDGSEHYYRNGHEFKPMSKTLTQTQMGMVSNLITDMTLRGATDDEKARAVRHSMVVIDAEKHKLDYKQSEIDNDIPSLKKKYQGHYDENGGYHEGASTLMSRAKSKKQVLKRKGNPNINPVTGEQTYDAIEYTDPKTGKLIFKPAKKANETYEVVQYKNDKGKWVKAEGDALKRYYHDKKNGTNLDNYKVTVKDRMQDSTKMAETSDAFTLVSDARTAQEVAYANYANKMKAMANQARKEMMATGRLEYDKDAASRYSEEVESLQRKLRISEMNAPKERHAQILANAEMKAKKDANPDMTKKEEKKLAQKALVRARNKVGAHRTTIDITDREWEAIQKGAISDTTLVKILNHTDTDAIRQRATPRAANELSAGQKARIKNLLKMGYTNAQIANSVGVSVSTINKYSE